MVGTPSEQPSPRLRTGGGTPPISARGANSARSRPLASARGARSTPATPRPSNDLVQVFIRMRPPRGPVDESIKFSVDRLPAPTPRALQQLGSTSDFGGLPPSTPRTALLQQQQQVSSGSSVTLTISGPSTDSSGGVDEHRAYEFQDVFDPSQEHQVTNSIIPNVVDQLRCGYNAAILCYGQTGSGKTFTMQQMIAALTDAVFGPGCTLDPSAAEASRVRTPIGSPAVGVASPLIDVQRDIVEMSYIQIYGNRSYDLLLTTSTRNSSSRNASAGSEPWGEPLPKPKGVLVSEPYVLVQSGQEFHLRIQEAQRRRVTSQHALNPVSSRSHTLLSLRISKCVNGTPVQTVKVTLVDLAGSERVKKSGVVGENLDEAIAINKSLSVLHAVIKAASDPDGASMLPIRESILTLYLAPVLTNSYFFLITTISLEVSNYFETKSTLEFATMAKRCVITRTRSMQVADRFRTNRAQEAIEQQLQQEIETLRQRVELLQAELELEKQQQRGDGALSVAPQVDPRQQFVTDHVHHLEAQFATLQNLLRDREAEKHMLIARKGLVDDIRKELEQRQCEREEARLELQRLIPVTSSLTPRDGASPRPTNPLVSGAISPEALSVAIDKVLESFMWLEEEHQGALEINERYERSMASLRDEHRQAEETVLRLRKRVFGLETDHQQAEALVAELSTNLREMAKKYDKLEFQFYREKQERITNEECNVLHQVANMRHAELEKVRAAFEDQRSLMDIMQSRLTDVERQLEASEVTRIKLVEENKARVASMCLAWSLFTPQQRGRYLSAEPSSGGAPYSSVSHSAVASPVTTNQFDAAATGGGSVFQGYDNIQLKATVRDLQKQLLEAQSQLEHRGYRVEDLEEEVKILQERLRSREDEYATLVKLDGQHVEQNEEMQNQISDLFSYIDAHTARQESLEARWRESQMEVEKLEEERKESQRQIMELTEKLDRTLDELREHEQNKDMLTARLKEAEAEKSTIARMRAEDQARAADLEKQLLRLQRQSNDISRKLDMAVNKRHHIAAEMTHHALQGEVLQKKLVRANGEEAKKRMLQLAKGVNQHRVFLANTTAHLHGVVPTAVGGPTVLGPSQLGNTTAMLEHMQRSNKFANLRFEVSQLNRNQNAHRFGDYEVLSARGASEATTAGSPPQYGQHAKQHRDPSVAGAASAAPRAPPPPQQLTSLRQGADQAAQQQAHHARIAAPTGLAPGSTNHSRKTSAAHAGANRATNNKHQPIPQRTGVAVPSLSNIKFAHHLAPRSVSPNPIRSTPAPAPPPTTHQVPSSAQPSSSSPQHTVTAASTAAPGPCDSPSGTSQERPIIPKLSLSKFTTR